MKDPVPSWTIERFLASEFKVFCTHEDGTVQTFTVMSVVKPLDGPDEITIRIEPPSQVRRTGKEVGNEREIGVDC